MNHIIERVMRDSAVNIINKPLCICSCTLLPSNQSFYRQNLITSHEKCSAFSGVGEW